MPPALQFLVLTFAGWVNRHQDDLIAYLREENRVLREHLGPRPLRLTDAQRRRLAVRGQKLGRKGLTQVAGIATPETILRWYRSLIAKTYDGSARRGRGRPMTRRDVAALVVRMAVENPQWGYTRIRGALSHLGHEIARTTVKRILHDHGIDPVPERSRRMPWQTFLQAHWEGLAACDLFTVEVLTLAGLRRYLVFFVIALQSRRVTIAGIHPQPYGAWMEQMARNLTDPVDGCLRRARYLIHDRDPLYTRVFGEILEGGGVQPIRLPPKSPNLNAYAERFVRSIKEECLSRVVPLGEAHLRLLVREYVEHYHRERNHQGLDNQLLQRPPPPVSLAADVQRRARLGGLLNFYHREATGVVGRLNAPYETHDAVPDAATRAVAVLQVVRLVHHQKVSIGEPGVERSTEGVSEPVWRLGREHPPVDPAQLLEQSPPQSAPTLRLLQRQTEAGHPQEEVAVGIEHRPGHQPAPHR